MSTKPPNPRDAKRLQSLEEDLKSQREAAARLTAEREDLQKRLKDLASAVKGAADERADQAKLIEAALKQFEKLLKTVGIPAPGERTLPAFLDALAAHVRGLLARLAAAEKQIAALEAQLASAAQALTEASDKFRELKELADKREAEHKAQVAALNKQLAESQKRIEQLEQSGEAISQLLAENQRLAAQIDERATEVTALRAAASEAKEAIAAARTETEARVRAELGAEIAKLTKQQTALQKQLDTALLQLKEEGKTPVLTADRVAVLLGDLVDQMQTSFGGLQVRDGELKLKVGFGAVGELSGFVVPTTESTPELRENLQEVTFRFDRSAPLTGLTGGG